jgi:hypothetical protein
MEDSENECCYSCGNSDRDRGGEHDVRSQRESWPFCAGLSGVFRRTVQRAPNFGQLGQGVLLRVTARLPAKEPERFAHLQHVKHQPVLAAQVFGTKTRKHRRLY